MQYQVILSHKPEGGYDVFTPLIPQWTIAVETRDEGLAKARSAITDFINRSEVVSIEVSPTQTNGQTSDVPWEWFGIGRDDPHWEQLFEEIEQNRNITIANETSTG